MKLIFLLLLAPVFVFANNITMTEADVHKTLLKKKTDINKCYQMFVAEGFRASGKVIMRWNIHPDGHASHVKTLKTIDPFVSNCLALKIRSWTFPKTGSDQIAEVKFPFIFQSKWTGLKR